MNDSALKKAIIFCWLVAAALVAIGVTAHVAGCSPVNVQVQQCENVVRDSSGFTFTGCRADGEQKTDGKGTIRVDIPKANKPEESRRVTDPRRPLADARMN